MIMHDFLHEEELLDELGDFLDGAPGALRDAAAAGHVDLLGIGAFVFGHGANGTSFSSMIHCEFPLNLARQSSRLPGGVTLDLYPQGSEKQPHLGGLCDILTRCYAN